MKKIFFNGNIYSMDKDFSVYNAFVVEDGIYKDAGTVEEIVEKYGEGAEKTDLEGRTVVPAFTDSHMHVISLGLLIKNMNQNECSSLEEMISQAKSYIEENNIQEGTWVRGRGWNQDNFTDEKRFPTRDDLDKISKTIPLVFTRTCGHVIVVNSKVLEIIGMEETAPCIEGGEIDVDEKGRPLGIFREMAINCVTDRIPAKSKDDLKELICLAQEEALSHGITEIHTDDFKDAAVDFQKVIDAYNELIEEGKLKIRIYEQCNLPGMIHLNEFLNKGYYTGWGNDYFKLGPFKVLADGSLGARTALLNEPYSDDPSTKGIGLFSPEEMDEMIIHAHKNNLQIAVHAIGDGAIDMVINSIEKAKACHKRDDERHGIIHCQITNSIQFDRMKELDIMAYIQPIFLNYDVNIVNERIGVDRAAYAYNWKDFIDKGILAAGGSDCPVESLNVMENIYSAVCRKTLSGYPEKGWKPEQNLSVKQAVELFTVKPAFASFSEDKKGSIEKGKIADFTVLEADIFTVDKETIKDVKVFSTYVSGEMKYKKS